MNLVSPLKDMTKKDSNIVTALMNILDSYNSLNYAKYNNKKNIVKPGKYVIANLTI